MRNCLFTPPCDEDNARAWDEAGVMVMKTGEDKRGVRRASPIPPHNMIEILKIHKCHASVPSNPNCVHSEPWHALPNTTTCFNLTPPHFHTTTSSPPQHIEAALYNTASTHHVLEHWRATVTHASNVPVILINEASSCPVTIIKVSIWYQLGAEVEFSQNKS